MKIKYIKTLPGGNATIIILSPEPRKNQPNLAELLMIKNYLAAEQVGYLESPTQKGAVARLQMMGGEFCGNAARSLACYLVQNDWQGVSWNGQIAQVKIEVSGVKKMISATVRQDAEATYFADVGMPFNQNISSVRKRKLINGMALTIVELEGITHGIVGLGDNQDFIVPKINNIKQIRLLKSELSRYFKSWLGWIRRLLAYYIVAAQIITD